MDQSPTHVKRLFIQNFPDDTTKQDVLKFFRKFGISEIDLKTGAHENAPIEFINISADKVEDCKKFVVFYLIISLLYALTSPIIQPFICFQVWQNARKRNSKIQRFLFKSLKRGWNSRNNLSKVRQLLLSFATRIAMFCKTPVPNPLQKIGREKYKN